MKNKIAWFLHRCGVTPNGLTYLGLLLALLAGASVYKAHLFIAGCLLLASGLVDLMDGAVARVSGKASVFGGILDSTLDRYGDAFVYIGILFHAWHLGRPDLAALTLSAGIGSFVVSYVRARAECEMDSCRVGFWERGERIGLLVIALLSSHLFIAIGILSVGVHWTAFQRLQLAKIQSRPDKQTPGPTPFYLKTRLRSDKVYLAKVLFLAGLVLGWNIP